MRIGNRYRTLNVPNVEPWPSAIISAPAIRMISTLRTSSRISAISVIVKATTSEPSFAGRSRIGKERDEGSIPKRGFSTNKNGLVSQGVTEKPAEYRNWHISRISGNINSSLCQEPEPKSSWPQKAINYPRPQMVYPAVCIQRIMEPDNCQIPRLCRIRGATG